MKKIHYIPLLALLMLLFISGCAKHEINNPFDSECPKNIWTPTGFTAKQQDNSILLSWSQPENNISGFRIDRKVGSGSVGNVSSPAKGSNSWTDNDIKGGQLHEYQLYAVAGNNTSNTVTAQVTPVILPTVTTGTASATSCSTATAGGNITNDGGATVTARGVCWNTSPSPTVNNSKTTDGSGTGSYSSSLTGLVGSTTYYVRAYVTNSKGTNYGSDVNFATPACSSKPTVTTSTPGSMTSNSAVLGGNVVSDGGVTVTERGICYSSTNTNPTTSDNKVIMGSGVGTFSSTVTGLAANTNYYVRAYAINSLGTGYGDPAIAFKTSSAILATVTTATPINPGTNSAVLGGNITADGGAAVTEKGICYSSTNTIPTTSDTRVIMGSGVGAFSNTVTGLIANTTYYVRAYAINSVGTSYGNNGVQIFKTGSTVVPPTVTMDTPSGITNTSAILGGNVTSEGSSSVTEKGICYSTTNQTPTTSDTKVTMGSSLGSFSSTVTGLTLNTTYYVRAYAINSQVTAYSSTTGVTFKTTVDEPFVTKTTVVSETFDQLVHNWSNGTYSISSGGVVVGTYWAEFSGGYYYMFYNYERNALWETINDFTPVASNINFEIEARVGLNKSSHDPTSAGIYGIAGITLFCNGYSVNLYYSTLDSIKILIAGNYYDLEPFQTYGDYTGFNLLRISRVGSVYNFYANHKLVKSLIISSLTGEVDNVGFIVSGGSRADYLMLWTEGTTTKSLRINNFANKPKYKEFTPFPLE